MVLSFDILKTVTLRFIFGIPCFAYS